MIRKISNIIYISVLAVVLFACGDDSTIEEQGSGTITARVMASNAYPALEEKVVLRSEERRVGKECRSRWSPYH